MSLTSPLAFAFDLLTAQIAVALSNVPGCLPDETATIVLQSIFQVPDLIVGGFANLTVTNFKVTCPSREASAALPKRGILDGVGRWAMAAKRQSQTPIELCGEMESGIFNDGAIFNCDQGPDDVPKIGDCDLLDAEVIDSISRGMTVTIPPRSGLVVSLFNNTCAFVFLNNDPTETYEMCFESIPDIGSEVLFEECPRRDGFIGSLVSERTPSQPNMHNWEAQYADRFLDPVSLSC
ncbi:hypothetical protein B0H13DRAFT_1922176 [Mycena leptocephala]|nr:hypothetical protein B0H13DRAFT_1922176 [Mycena leptocephala]